MTRRPTFLLALAIAACNQTPIETPVRSFDRPSDAALTCAIYDPTADAPDPMGHPQGLYQPRALSACAPLPAASVEVGGGIDPATMLPRYLDPTTGLPYTPVMRALVANSARGEVALVDVPNAILIDLDRENPGFNFIPVGRLPEAIRASEDGCLAVTANADSCDLAVLDLTTLYNMPFVVNRPGRTRDYARDVVRHVQLYAGGKRLEARPTALELTREVEFPGTGLSCQAGVHHAWVALPGCQAVVEVSLSLDATDEPVRAEVTRAIQVTAGGATLLADPSTLSCPAECTAGAAPDQPAGPTSPSSGRLPAGQASPGALALDFEDQTARLLIGDAYGERIDVVPLAPKSDAAGAPAAGTPAPARAITLEAGALGVSRLRVSPRGPAGKFLYAVARDGTVRVVDLDRELECETNPDPTAFGAVPPEDPVLDARRLGCLPLGDPSTPRRSAQAVGPGISLPGGALARDVAFVHLDIPVPPISGPPLSAQPALLVGDYAWVVGSDGHAQLIQIYDACPQPNEPVLPDGTYLPVCALANARDSRAAAFAQFGGPYPIELERVSHRLRNGERRFLQPNNPQDAAGTPRIQDPMNPVTVTVSGSPIKAVQGRRIPKLELVSRSAPASLGLSGAAAQIALYVPDPERARDETWTLSWQGAIPGTLRAFGTVCAEGSASCPRGTIVDAGAAFCARGVEAGDELELVGCDTDADCLYTQVCAHHPAAPFQVVTGLCLDRDAEDEQVVRCAPLLRAQRRYRIVAAKQGVPLASGAVTDLLELDEIYESAGRRCDPTGKDASVACGDGFLCAETHTSTAAAPDFRCMRAPLDVGLFHDCLKAAQRYQVRVGGGFSVVGSASGFLSELEPDPISHECAPPALSLERVRLRSPRIPLDAPLCPMPGDADALSWVGSAGPNACRIETGDTDLLLHFENPLFSFALRLPVESPGQTPADDTLVSFVVVGGGFPMGVTLGVPGDLSAQAPRTALVAPDRQTVFVVDEGKGGASTSLRGQLLRLVSAVQAVDPAFRVR